MRDIKIKFWDVDNKCMHHWIENFEEIAIVNGNMKPVLNNSVSDNWNWYKRNYEPLQYTGLKDKNGKEIYEGDVIGCDGLLWCVNYDMGSYTIGFTLDAINHNESCVHHLTWEKGEVIGNVYENPELLEGN